MQKSSNHTENLLSKTLLSILIISALFSLSSLHAATVPVYQRIYAISENLKSPTSIAVDASERVYVAESPQNRVTVYTAGGSYIKSLGGLDKPTSVAVNSLGSIYVGNAITGNVEIYNYDFDLLGKIGSGDGEFGKPCDIHIDSLDNIYVADCSEDNIKIFNPDGSFNRQFGVSGNSSGMMNKPSSVAVNETASEIFVVDTRYASGMMGAYQNPRVQVFDMNGVYKRVFGRRGVAEGKLYRPWGIEIDGNGRVYITDTYQHVVQVFDNLMVSLGVIYDMNNSVRAPMGITMSSNNRLYVASVKTDKVEVFGIDSYLNLEVSPKIVNFEEGVGSTVTATQDVQVINSGTVDYNWSASSNDSWITISQTPGLLTAGTSSTITVGTDVTGLALGTYNGTVDVATDTGVTETITVTLDVVSMPEPEMAVAPTLMTFTSTNGSIPATQSFTVDNNGGGTLTWTASADQPWIAMDKNSGSAPDVVNLSVSPVGLGEGIYTSVITVDGQSEQVGVEYIYVTLNVVDLRGTVNVITNNLAATFIINGPDSYSGSGTSWSASNAPVGTYVIVYGDINGYTTPASEAMTLQDGGIITFNGQYEENAGVINVSSNIEDAFFTITGPVTYSGTGASWTVNSAPEGTYTIMYHDVAGYFAPDGQTTTLVKDGVIDFSGQYEVMPMNIIAGAGAGETNPGTLEVYGDDGTYTGLEITAQNAYGVNVAAGDIDGDGMDEIITAPGPDPLMPAEINIYNRNGGHISYLSIFAFDHTQYLYGANVASADFDGDGYYEVIVGAGPGKNNDAYVKIFTYNPQTQRLEGSGVDFFAYSLKYGVNVTTGDVNGDGIPELITSPGAGSRNLGIIRVWSIDTSAGAGQWVPNLLKEFTVLAENKYSVTIASADLNGDGLDEIIAGDGPHNAARDIIRIYDQDGNLLNLWQAGTAFNGYGARVAAGDLDRDGVAEILVAPGPGEYNMSYIKVLDFNGVEKAGFDPLSLPYGANIAVGNLGL